MDDLITRWRRAAERALDEGVRIVNVGGKLYATSTSRPLGSYQLAHTDEGWGCACQANEQYRVPCKHLSLLADTLGLDVLADMRVEWPPREQQIAA